jgi:hypothetical protein
MLLSPSKKIVGKEKGGRLSEEDEPKEMGVKSYWSGYICYFSNIHVFKQITYLNIRGNIRTIEIIRKIRK